MKTIQKTKKTPSARRLYRASKISDYKFRQVLDHFVRDHTVSETAIATRLSANSVHAIFQKIRAYLGAVHYYQPYIAKKFENEEAQPDSYHAVVLEYHARRKVKKRGLKESVDEADLHFLESFWRFDYHLLYCQRPSAVENVYAMMKADLLALFRVCGAVGSKPKNIWDGRSLLLKQQHARALWLVRNGSDFQEGREELMEILEG